MATATQPMRPFQHAAEVSIAARGGHVVLAAINLHTNGPETLAAADLVRMVAIATSHDGGAHFSLPVDPGFMAAETSDPVVRAGDDGVFWLSAIGIEGAGSSEKHRLILMRSLDGGRSFTAAHRTLPVEDKEWIAPAPDHGLVMAASGGFWRFDASGALVDSWDEIGFGHNIPDWPVFGAFVDSTGAAHFVLQDSIVRWNGGPRSSPELSLRHENEWFDPGWSVPIGPLPDGGLWAVYGRHNPDNPRPVNATNDSVRIRLKGRASERDEDVAVSASPEIAFMPTAALDGEGRLHVAYYDSSGAIGVLKYTRSFSSDLRAGFQPPRVLDDHACPGGGWYPEFARDSVDRRLREYIDLAIDGRRVHVAWTHAPVLPTRIWTQALDF